LFRFHAWYGRGEIDKAALEAAISEKAGLKRLSGERIRSELLKLLGANEPMPTLRTMQRHSIVSEVLPWRLSLERLGGLVHIESENGFPPDALLRLAALMPSDVKAMHELGDRLKLSNAERDRLVAAAASRMADEPSEKEARAMLYRLGVRTFKDAALLQWASGSKGSWRAQVQRADTWRRPRFPVDGRDALAAGLAEGPAVGKALGELEQWWIDNDFAPGRAALLARLKERAAR
jgi:poly(A) polymerase